VRGGRATPSERVPIEHDAPQGRFTAVELKRRARLLLTAVGLCSSEER